MFILQRPDLTESEPLSLQALKDGLQNGLLAATTPARRVESTQWIPLGELLALVTPQSSAQPPAPPPIPTPAQLPTSNLAIASLVCGILTLPTCGLGGIAAWVCGILALITLSKNRGKLKGEGMAYAGIICGGVFLLAGGPALLLPALAKAKARAQSINCINNMKQICLELRVYADSHQDSLPPDLKAVIHQSRNPRILVCPGDSRQVQAAQTGDWKSLQLEDVSYEFLTPGAQLRGLKGDTVILRCPIHGHEGHEDGSVMSGLRYKPANQR